MKAKLLYNEIIIKQKRKSNVEKLSNIISKSINNCCLKVDIINKDDFKYRHIKIERKMSSKKNILIQMVYEFERKETKIFGFKFIRNNKNKCFMVKEGKKCKIVEYCNGENYKKIKIKLIIISNIINLEAMFLDCNSLLSINDISKWNTINVTNITKLFYKCSSLKSLPDISKLNTINITNISGLFNNCSSLKSLPDISK